MGGLRVANVKNRVAPELLTAFTDDMYRCRTASAADYYPESEPGEVVTVHEFVGAGDLGGLCQSGLDEMRAVAAAHAPIVVLAEGKSDIAVLESALRLLYPHLTDLVRFMDYGDRPMGGAGALVNTVRSFAAAGIANRVVVLFDNDTAAADALRGLADSDLPANIQIRRFPPLDLARDYPTLGPPAADAPAGRLANADVNGLAGSIELYPGRDVLSGPDGVLRPVQWRSYIAGQGRYQGEIIEKDAVHQAYRAKVRAAEADRARMAGQDWSGLRAIFDLVLSAFG